MAAQVARLTGGPPLLCVLHKGRRAFVARAACRACRVGLVVTGPYRPPGSGGGEGGEGGEGGRQTDYYVRCAKCGEMEMVSASRVPANG
jgi:hypothetical protein